MEIYKRNFGIHNSTNCCYFVTLSVECVDIKYHYVSTKNTHVRYNSYQI